jgi:subtilisin family serine protease
VGASGAYKGKKIIGSFSNYGKKEVDFFAPGVAIYSTIPDNKYTVESGTSMACPSTAGAAAIIREYFPELKASEVRTVMMKTVTPYKKKVMVPGLRKPKMLRKKKTKASSKKASELSVSGGFLNVNNAVIELLAGKK